eukprot:555906_1
MYQKLLKNIQARINSKDNKKPMSSNMKSNDDNIDSITNPNKKLNITTNNSSSKPNSNSNNSLNSNSILKSKNHLNNSNAMIGGDIEDEKDEYSIEDLLNAEVSLREVQNADDRKGLFIKKLKLCCIIFDFTVADLDQNHQLAKEMKRTYLLELVEYISQSKHWFSEDCVPVILEMIGTNLFRSLPPPVYEDFDPEEDEPNLIHHGI